MLWSPRGLPGRAVGRVLSLFGLVPDGHCLPLPVTFHLLSGTFLALFLERALCLIPSPHCPSAPSHLVPRTLSESLYPRSRGLSIRPWSRLAQCGRRGRRAVPRPSCPDQEGRKGSEEGVPENLSVPLEGDRDFGELGGSHQGCQVPFRN